MTLEQLFQKNLKNRESAFNDKTMILLTSEILKNNRIEQFVCKRYHVYVNDYLTSRTYVNCAVLEFPAPLRVVGSTLFW
jgi:hypothetical protein